MRIMDFGWCVNFSAIAFALSGLLGCASYPGLTPWAAIFRCFAALCGFAYPRFPSPPTSHFRAMFTKLKTIAPKNAAPKVCT
jgi:hypothetical protein